MALLRPQYLNSLHSLLGAQIAARQQMLAQAQAQERFDQDVASRRQTEARESERKALSDIMAMERGTRAQELDEAKLQARVAGQRGEKPLPYENPRLQRTAETHHALGEIEAGKVALAQRMAEAKLGLEQSKVQQGYDVPLHLEAGRMSRAEMEDKRIRDLFREKAARAGGTPVKFEDKPLTVMAQHYRQISGGLKGLIRPGESSMRAAMASEDLIRLSTETQLGLKSEIEAWNEFTAKYPDLAVRMQKDTGVEMSQEEETGIETDEDLLRTIQTIKQGGY